MDDEPTGRLNQDPDLSGSHNLDHEVVHPSYASRGENASHRPHSRTAPPFRTLITAGDQPEILGSSVGVGRFGAWS
ncbi:hypothetical protein U1Q18_031353, partial [Sarracenia purpurea var. burkii]